MAVVLMSREVGSPPRLRRPSRCMTVVLGRYLQSATS